MNPFWMVVLFVLCLGAVLGMVLFALALAIADTRRERAWRNMQGPIRWDHR